MGINSGKCLAGNVGSSTRLKFTLLGDEINVAARLEGFCKQYGVYLAISDSTFCSPDVEETFCCRVLDRVAVVGRAKATVVREVLSRRADATQEQLELERLSNRMLKCWMEGDMPNCLATLEQMNDLKPHDIAISKLIVRVR
jgi:adenylate cyclase